MQEEIIDSERTKVLVLTRSQVEKMEVDSEDDFRDEVCTRLKISKCNKLYGTWDAQNSHYTVLVQT